MSSTAPNESTQNYTQDAINDELTDEQVQTDENDGGDITTVVEFTDTRRSPVEVNRKNKLICTIGFLIIIILCMGYIIGLANLQSKRTEASLDPHFKEPIILVYIVTGTDIFASGLGIVTCLAKTGPKPMILVCIWLLLTSLANLCAGVMLLVEQKPYRDKKESICLKHPNSENCLAYSHLTWYLGCSLFLVILKVAVILLCRINYPQVFNWMVGKHVYVDEKLIPIDVNQNHVSNFGGAYFSPCDLERLTARGSLGGKVQQTDDERTIFVTKPSTLEIINDNPNEDRRGSGEYTILPRRATFISISPSEPSSELVSFHRTGRIV